jgi:hypothetical protein
MTIDNETKVKPLSELRETIRYECLAQIDHASKAALAVPSEPRWTYRLRVMQAVIEASPDLSEQQIFSAWKDDPQLAPYARIVHSTLCNARFSRLAGSIDQWLNEETRKNEAHLAWIEQRNTV